LDIALNKKSILIALEEEVDSAPGQKNNCKFNLQYFNESNYEDCIRAAEKAFRIKPEYPDAYNNIGIGYF